MTIYWSVMEVEEQSNGLSQKRRNSLLKHHRRRGTIHWSVMEGEENSTRASWKGRVHSVGVSWKWKKNDLL